MKLAGVKLREIAAELGRTLEAVRTRNKRLVAQGRIPAKYPVINTSWTDEEEAILHELLDYNELEEALPGKTRRAIQAKCEKLGISKRLAGHRICAGTLNPSLPTTLYLVDFGEVKKVGVCQVPIKERLSGYGTYTLLDEVVLDLDTALEMEAEILRSMREFAVKGTMRRGWSECFVYSCASLEELF